MFKNILIPTDGSAVANKAVKAGIELASQLGAKVTGYYAVEAIQPRVYGEGYMINNKTIKVFEQQARQVGQKHIDSMAKIAGTAGIKFTGVMTMAETPYDGIIETAKKQKCDAIFMASHGRRGLAGIIMGSVTHKVLTHSKLPVLVYR